MTSSSGPWSPMYNREIAATIGRAYKALLLTNHKNPNYADFLNTFTGSMEAAGSDVEKIGIALKTANEWLDDIENKGKETKQ